MVFGLLMNPRSRDLYCAIVLRGPSIHGFPTREIGIFDLTSDSLKYVSGMLDPKSPHDPMPLATRLTGLPRAHINWGAIRPGRGFGTVLYTSLCFAVMLQARGNLDLGSIWGKGDGICSMPPRSESAEAWWQRARTRYGLTHMQRGVDVYPYTKAVERGLVVARVEGDHRRWLDVPVEDVVMINWRSLMHSNLHGLKTRYPPGEGRAVFESLVAIARRGGAKPDVIEWMEFRYEYGVDPDAAP